MPNDNQMNWLMAHYDSSTDQIYGCKKFSAVWYHEDRHRQQWKSGMLRFMWSMKEKILPFAVLAILIDERFIGAMILAGYWLIEVGVDLDAHVYSFCNRNNWKGWS